MKLIRFGPKGQERAGIVARDGSQLDVSAFGEDYDSRFLESDGVSRLEAWLEKNQVDCPHIPVGTRLGPPLAQSSKIVCVGLNYALHARESGMDIPSEPVLFFKSTTAICGPFDEVMIPRGAEKVDWEVELAVVIGKKASYVEEADAMEYVAGYMLHNDVSERAFQLEKGGQWVKGKSADTFAPLGPWLVSRDEIADPHKLDLWLKVNGQLLQNSNTSDLVFSIPELVSYISQYMTLLPGDIISTGTPSGVGLGLKPPRYLAAGDTMELSVEGLGTSRQKVIAFQKHE